MKWFRRAPRGIELDRELEQAERDVWRAMFETSQKMKPDDEFARRLESRLRTQAHASQAARRTRIRPLAKSTPSANVRAITPLRNGQAPRRGRLELRGRMMGFAVGAVRLSVLVVVVLGMAVLWRGGLRPTTGTTVTTIGPVGPNRSQEELMREFLPPGKVRHLVVEHSYTPVPGVDPNNRPQAVIGRQEVWLANGREHPILRTQADLPANAYSLVQPIPETDGLWTVPVASLSALIDDDYIYENLEGAQVMKHPFNSRYLMPFLPSDGGLLGFISESLSRVTGYTTLRGREVMLLEDLSPVAPVVKHAPNRNEPNHFVLNTYVAVDTNTRQLVQARRVTTFITGKLSGQQATNTYDLLVDELKDASEFPPDFFKLNVAPQQRVLLYSGDVLFYDLPNPNAPATVVPASDLILPAVTNVLTDTNLDQTRTR
jgi:hypothetical protein